LAQNLDKMQMEVKKQLLNYDVGMLRRQYEHTESTSSPHTVLRACMFLYLQYFRIRKKYWEDDGWFEIMEEQMPEIVIAANVEDEDDEDDDYDDMAILQCRNEQEADDEWDGDEVPYGEDEWRLLENLDWMKEVFADEIALGQCMVDNPAKRRAFAKACGRKNTF